MPLPQLNVFFFKSVGGTLVISLNYLALEAEYIIEQ